jgi:cytochrome c oxidase subunit IV
MSDQSTTAHGASSTAHGAHASFDTKPIWRTFWILLGITAVELILATIHLKTGFPNKYVLNGVYLILTLSKAFYIIAEFMHLRHEIKNMIMTIAVPALLFVWFIVAFLWDGGSYNNLRNRYDAHYRDANKVKVAPEGGERAPAAQKPGEQQ